MDMSFWTAPGLAALGVRRSGGMYRIARQDLMVRLQQLQQAPMEHILSPSAVPGGPGLTANKRSINDIAGLDTYHISLDSTRQNPSSWIRCGISSHQVSSPATPPS
jgi:hypothetical protein